MARIAFREIDSAFAEAFRIARTRAGRSQEQVADAMRELGFDMSQPTVGKIERGQRRVTVGEADALAHVIGASITGLTLGPDYLTVEYALEQLRLYRTELKEAINKFQSAQQLVAMVASDVSSLEDFQAQAGMLEDAVLESPLDVLDDLQRDHLAEHAGKAHRDGLLRDGAPRPTKPERSPTTLLDHYYEKFGETVMDTPHPEVAGRIFGRPDALKSAPPRKTADNVRDQIARVERDHG